MNAINTLLQGLLYTILGMVIVFFVLILLSFLVSGLKFFSGSEKRTINNKKEIKKPQLESMKQNEMDNSDELIAVIAAAVSSYMDVGIEEFKIKKITRIQDNSPMWKKVALGEQIHSRL